MKNYINRISRFIISIITIVCLTSGIICNKAIAGEGNPNTLEEELESLQKKLLNIEESIANLSIGINTVKENLTVFLIKKDKDVDITYLELTIHEKSWYKHAFTPEDNKFLERATIGKVLTRFFWGNIKKMRSRIRIRCFYRMKDDKNKKEYKIIKKFNLTPKAKLSNFLSITLQKDEDPESEQAVDLKIAFW